MPLELIDRPGAADNSIGLVTCPNCQVRMQILAMKPVKLPAQPPGICRQPLPVALPDRSAPALHLANLRFATSSRINPRTIS
jgi:hypothetical protein